MDRGDEDGGPGCVGTVAGPVSNEPNERDCHVSAAAYLLYFARRRLCVLLRNVSIAGDLGLRSVCRQRARLLHVW
jgi:hypothetical protein